jgi:hypothetical protein
MDMAEQRRKVTTTKTNTIPFLKPLHLRKNRVKLLEKPTISHNHDPRDPQNIRKEHIVSALAAIDKVRYPKEHESIRYSLIYEGRKYPPVWIIRTANIFANKKPLDTSLYSGGAAIVYTGRSDFPNQINNALSFPGVFRWALDACATRINDDMKVAAAHAIADYVQKPQREHIVPPLLDREVTRHVAAAVKEAAIASGCAREL